MMENSVMDRHIAIDKQTFIKHAKRKYLIQSVDYEF